MQTISSMNAPAAIGPYSQAIKSNGLLFCSGSLGIDPQSGKLIDQSVNLQVEQAFKNIRAILESEKLSVENIVKTTVFLASMEDFKIVNEIYAANMGTHKPARSTVQVARLPLDAKVEIECIAEYPQ